MAGDGTDTAGRCLHCDAPVPESRRSKGGEGAEFCCGGCRAVYRAIRSAGLDDYYDFQDRTSARPPPVDPETEGGAYRDFDAESFLEEFAEIHEDGSRSIELRVDGVHCSGCVWLIERMPSRLDGVLEARLNLARGRLSLRWRQEETPLSEVAAWLEHFGYDAHPASAAESSGPDRAERDLLRRLGVCAALAANVMLLAFAFYSGLGPGSRAGLYEAFRWASFVLASGAVAYGGATFFRRAWGSLRPLFAAPGEFDWGKLSIDIPISIGILGGYLHSAVATFRGHGEVWFDSVTVLIAALLGARWLQVRGQRLAREAADRLLNVVPRTARRLETDADGTWIGGTSAPVETGRLEAGDYVEVRPTETVPVDGRVVEGASSLELGVLTGESRPEAVEIGDRVYAGATNGAGRLVVEVRAAGDDSRVGALMEWVRTRDGDAAPVVELADRLAGIFVVAVLAAAAATWVGWTVAGSSQALRHAVALLVIACPCALGMATPLAMTVGVGRAARRGIYVKRDAIFEQLDRVDELIVDKTGTVTAGSMRIVDSDGAGEAFRLASVLESESVHPVGRALAREVSGDVIEDTELSEVEETPGQGISGRVEGCIVEVGRPEWIRQRVRDRAPGIDSFLDAAASEGHTPVAVAVDGRIAAAAALGDPVRSRAREFLDRLREQGVSVTMLSGDHPEVVERVRGSLGIPADRAHGHVSPEEKCEYVRRRRAEGEDRRVAMVGDGVNDAAALEAADVGVAVGGAAAPSFAAADVFTTRDGMEPLFELLTGAEGVLRTIRRNVGMSVVYNTLGISAAAAGLVGPLAAAVAMPASSVAVVLSSVLQGAFDRDTDRSTALESDEHAARRELAATG